MDKFKNEKAIYKLITLAVLAAAVFFVYRIVYAGIIAMPYPKELLEPSNVALTNEFLKGQSPYTRAALTRQVPGTNYDYPFLNSLITAGIAKVTGCSAVTAHFVISLVSIIASGLIGYCIVARQLSRDAEQGRNDETTEKESGRRGGYTTVAPVLAGLLFMFCHFRFGYISASPDDLGLLFLLLTAYASVHPKIPNKPLICALGITLCFYTKQYFVFVAAGIFIYMLLYSWRDAISLFIWSLIINAAIFAIIMINWPLYWTKAFLFTYIGTAVGGGGAVTTLIDQFKYLIVLFAALFVIIIVAAAKALKKLYQSKGSIRNLRIRENDAFAMSVVQTIVMLVPLYIIGRNDGAFLSYFLQLWMPFVTVVALVSFERMRPEKHEFIYMTVYAVIIVFTVYFGFGKLPLHILTSDETANWQKAVQYIDTYSENGDIYYARELSYEGMKRQNGEYLCGHDGEADDETAQTLSKAGVPEEYLEDAYAIIDQNKRYRDTILEKAANGGYSLITVDTSDAYTPFTADICEQCGYRQIDAMDLQLGNMPYEVLFYVK